MDEVWGFLEEEGGLFVEQIDICLCVFVRHPPQPLLIFQADRAALLDGAIRRRQAAR